MFTRQHCCSHNKAQGKQAAVLPLSTADSGGRRLERTDATTEVARIPQMNGPCRDQPRQGQEKGQETGPRGARQGREISPRGAEKEQAGQEIRKLSRLRWPWQNSETGSQINFGKLWYTLKPSVRHSELATQLSGAQIKDPLSDDKGAGPTQMHHAQKQNTSHIQRIQEL